VRQDRGPGPGHAEEPLVCQVGDRDAGVYGARDVRGALRRGRRRLRFRHVHAGNGHQRVPLQRMQRPRSDLQESHQREFGFIGSFPILFFFLSFFLSFFLCVCVCVSVSPFGLGAAFLENDPFRGTRSISRPIAASTGSRIIIIIIIISSELLVSTGPFLGNRSGLFS